MNQSNTPRKMCAHCLIAKPHKYFNENARRKDGYEDNCQRCESAIRGNTGQQLKAYNVDRPLWRAP